MWIEDSDVQIFHFENFMLTIHPSCCLVVVTNSSRDSQNKVEDVPHWVFDSKHVIWLTEEDKPILHRAQKGEAIRKRLQSLRSMNLQAAG